MLSPSLGLLASIAGILILLRLKFHPGLAIFAGSLIISLLILPLHSIPELMFRTLKNYQTLRLLVIVASALTLSGLMEEKGLLAKLAITMERISPKLTMHLIPAAIGLVPMPAGALVSATTLHSLVKRINLKPEQATFINYWFRHIWEYSLPMYPSIILTSVLLSVQLSSVVITLLPMTALAVASGAIFSHRLLKKGKFPELKEENSSNIVGDLIKSSWPILLLVPLILLGVDGIIAFPATSALLALQQKVKWKELKKALKHGLDPKILFLLYAVMLYKAAIESSGTAQALSSDMHTIGVPTSAILATLPFLIGFATGISLAFVGVTFPLLIPFIALSPGINDYALLLAYTSGMVGILLSPLHLCLILSAEYFKANLIKVYKYITPPLLIIEATAVVIYYLMP